MAEKRPHIRVPVDGWREKKAYQPPPRKIEPNEPPDPAAGRAAHAAVLQQQLRAAVDEAAARRAHLPLPGPLPGVRVEFESLPEWPLMLQELESRKARDPAKQITILAAQTTGAPPIQRATVFVPHGQIGHFLEQLEAYATSTPSTSQGKGRVFNRIAQVRLAALKSLWTDEPEQWPASEESPLWWEVWLRRTDGRELERLHILAEHAGFRLGERRLMFDERIVTLVFASARQLAGSVDVLNDLAELQRARESARFFTALRSNQQAEWASDLHQRLQPPPPQAPVVCVLDTGVNAGHPLLECALPVADRHTCNPKWGKHDHEGHGTEMAGLALYGDLVHPLSSQGPVALQHGLESVKILPPDGSNPPELYAAIMADATTHPEITAPERTRIFSMSVTAGDGRDRGQPTSWSSALDALAAGRSFDASTKGLTYLDEGDERRARLFVVSAGNVSEAALCLDHLDSSDTDGIQDPAHAWNVLTVGAHTDKAVLTDPAWKSWSPVAERGELSPWSTTSLMFHEDWPLKPDLVMEGGNVVHDGAGNIDFPCDDLCLLTTHHQPFIKPFTPTWATSAATAQAARLCALIAASQPDYWPETIRALAVHSARWTPAMLAHFRGAKTKGAKARLVRRYGYGVPNLDRALASARNTVSLVVQDTIHPFSDGTMQDIHLHRLPWPSDILAALGEVEVRLRVTLSYFIEPNPGRRGWQKRHRYASHGLRFRLKGATESEAEFTKRINQLAREENEKAPDSPGDDGWFLGPTARDHGSIHTDFLKEGTTAADLAARGFIAVHPVAGWWKEQPKRDRSALGARYALIVTIETDAQDVDIWTPIAQQVGIEVEV
jgi:hypothetical protein